MNKTEIFKKIDKYLGRFLIRILPKAKVSEEALENDPGNILLIKTVAIGDLVVLLPTIKALKEKFPKSKLTLLTTPRVKEVVEGFKYIDEIIYFDVLGKDKGLRGLIRLLRKLRKEKFDLSVDFEHYYNFTTILCRLAGIRSMAGFAIEGQIRKKLFNIPIEYKVDVHEVEAFYEAANVVRGRFSGSGLFADQTPEPSPRGQISLENIVVSTQDKEAVEQFLTANNISKDDLVVGVHPGTSESAKVRRWFPSSFAKVIESLINDYKARVVITGTAADNEIIAPIIDSLPATPYPLPVDSTNFTLKQTAFLLKRCNLVISVDTGPMHIAAAMGTKTIGLFGPNTPVKWGPYGCESLSVYKELDCSPCTKQYLGEISKCRTGECMLNITVDDVLGKVKEILDARKLQTPSIK